MRALLPLVILLLAACDFGGASETSSGPFAAAQSTTHNGGGSSGSGGSSGGGSPPSSPSPPAVAAVNVTGIWDIKDTVNGNPVTEVALIAGGKYYSLAGVDRFGCADITGGTYTVNGAMFTGSGLTVLLNNCTGPHNQGRQPYTLNGYMTNGYLNLIFDIGGVGVPTLGATMDPLYNEPASLAKLTGNWNDAGNTLTINPDGTFFEQTGSGCVVNGAYTVIDPMHNLYGVSFEITNCSSSLAGIVFTGLGYLDDSNPNAWHFLEDVSGPDPANGGATVLAFNNITPE